MLSERNSGLRQCASRRSALGNRTHDVLLQRHRGLRLCMAVVEQQLQDLQQEHGRQQRLEERWRIVEQKLGEPGVGPGERERQERLEERLNIVEQKLAEPGVGPDERRRHQRLEERLNIVDQQLLDQDRRRSMVEQQWHNRHARRLEEQAKLLQELRDEQERLRDEQEKIKDNEQRIGEKNNMSGAAQGLSLIHI